jgi:NitT/TauT family transport system substrate-binding protein
MTRLAKTLTALATLTLALMGCRGQGEKKAPAALTTLRLGFFPNLTHAVPIVGLVHGDFARALGPVGIDGKPFNAGPEAMEALFAGALDACYVGPAPAISGYLRSHGEGLVIVAGAAANGAGLVVRKDAGIAKPEDLHGKKLASPQLGNTQDIALRTYLGQLGMKSKDRGGDVQVMPLANPDILALMKQKQLDGAWVPEPWLSRLIDEADGQLFLDERDRWPGHTFPITVLVVTKKLADEHPELVKKLVQANQATIEWIHAHDAEARTVVDDGLLKWAKKRLPPKVLADAWSRVEITNELSDAALQKQLVDGRALGFLPAGDLTGIFDRRFAATPTPTAPPSPPPATTAPPR